MQEANYESHEKYQSMIQSFDGILVHEQVPDVANDISRSGATHFIDIMDSIPHKVLTIPIWSDRGYDTVCNRITSHYKISNARCRLLDINVSYWRESYGTWVINLCKLFAFDELIGSSLFNHTIIRQNRYLVIMSHADRSSTLQSQSIDRPFRFWGRIQVHEYNSLIVWLYKLIQLTA